MLRLLVVVLALQHLADVVGDPLALGVLLALSHILAAVRRVASERNAHKRKNKESREFDLHGEEKEMDGGVPEG